ncbi:hypothetical protein EV356DRAFT_536506 [Viridothelium virens]|uniref:Uncharacterized protein n=1 Tax=Viridothelium virens TaxID=1048519 RepID=A0A6A6GX85_VIRVR|nr:hypothetical protein EV356DRAFT_536506 [Viridothelium virens]
MAPIRRYLRITRYSVLEVRIYLDNPALAQTWLLNSRDPVLPRVIESVRPLVLPKLREENERAKGKGKGKKKGVKDVVTTDEYEVSIFLTEPSTRHSILTKQKDFEKKASRLKSNSGKLTSWLTNGNIENPVDVPDDDASRPILREEDDTIDLDEIPDAEMVDNGQDSHRGMRKRSRQDSRDGLFVDEEGDSDDAFESSDSRAGKRKRSGNNDPEDDHGKTDDKKKLGLNTSYDGFSIYGRILCLVIKRRGGKVNSGPGAADTGQQMLENWVSTQAAQDQGIEDDDEG